MNYKYIMPFLKTIIAAILISVIRIQIGYPENTQKVLQDIQMEYESIEKKYKDMIVVEKRTVHMDDGVAYFNCITYKKGIKFRTEIEMKAIISGGFPAIKITLIFDGKDCWIVSSTRRGKERVADEDMLEYQRELNWWNSLKEHGKLLGIKTLRKKKCYIIKSKKLYNIPFVKMWIDLKNHFVLQEQFQDENDDTIKMKHYKFGKKWKKPYLTKIYINGKHQTTIEIESIKVNQGLSDSLFDPDKQIIDGMDVDEILKILDDK